MTRDPGTVHSITMISTQQWTLVLAAALGLSCGAPQHVRQTRIDDGREDDHWLEGARCGATEAPTTPDDKPVRVEVIEQGSGEVAESGMTVRVHYVAKSATGEVLHDTRKGGAPNQIVIGSTHTICGFEKGLAGMRAGEQRRVFVPWQLAFGEAGKPPEIQPKTDLVFVIDLFFPTDHVSTPYSGPAKPPPGGGRRR
jgi:hypothetical protein